MNSVERGEPDLTACCIWTRNINAPDKSVHRTNHQLMNYTLLQRNNKNNNSKQHDICTTSAATPTAATVTVAHAAAIAYKYISDHVMWDMHEYNICNKDTLWLYPCSHHHHHAVGGDATKAASIRLTTVLHLSLCCASNVRGSVFMSLCFSFLLILSLKGDEGAIWRSRPKHALALAILLCISSSMRPILVSEVG